MARGGQHDHVHGLVSRTSMIGNQNLCIYNRGWQYRPDHRCRDRLGAIGDPAEHRGDPHLRSISLESSHRHHFRKLDWKKLMFLETLPVISKRSRRKGEYREAIRVR